jgi:uncharacterized protein (TIGR03083 family)
VDTNHQIARIRAEGAALAAAAESGPFDAPVPNCPGWDIDVLLRHIGDVHRWAATIVRERLPERLQTEFDGPGERVELLAWYREGCDALVAVLEAASPDDAYWYWGPAPNALAFWARRQANETAVHRCDAEAARGAIAPLSAEDALDAIDEWFGLAFRSAKAPEGAGRVLRLVTTDSDASWNVMLGERIEVTSDRGSGDCELRGTTSDLYLWSMNRRGTEGITVSGDQSLLRVWADNVQF